VEMPAKHAIPLGLRLGTGFRRVVRERLGERPALGSVEMFSILRE
jgi:hypothetical protein